MSSSPLSDGKNRANWYEVSVTISRCIFLDAFRGVCVCVCEYVVIETVDKTRETLCNAEGFFDEACALDQRITQQPARGL